MHYSRDRREKPGVIRCLIRDRSGIDDVEQELKSGGLTVGDHGGGIEAEEKDKGSKKSTQGTRPTASTSRTEQWFKGRPEKGEMPPQED
jgi:hypothetical protein